MGTAPVHVAVRSMNRLLREAVAASLAGQPNMAVVGVTAEIPDLVSVCRLRPVTVVVIDIAMDFADVLDNVRLMRAARRDLGVVFTYANLSASNVATAHRAGVTRLIPYARGMSAIVEAVRAGPHEPDDRRRRPPTLTERDLEILSLMSSGYSVREMARMLGIAQSTVENHKRRIFAKMSAHSQAHVVSLAARMGLLSKDGRSAAPAVERGNLVVVLGSPGPRRNTVLESLIKRGVSVLATGGRWDPAREETLLLRGPIVAVLVDATAEDWRSVRALGARVVAVTEPSPREHAVADALLRGADAMLPINDVPGGLADAVTLATHGSSAPAGPATRELPRSSAITLGTAAATMPSVRAGLSTRELEILRSIAAGHSVRQTGRALGITSKTVENIQTRLFRKLAVRNRAEALSVAYDLGLIAND